jgi:TonB family protein
MGDVDVHAWTAQPRFLLVLFVQAVVAFFCFAAIVGLRFVRRGAARFWIGPALVALCLLPGVVGAALTALAFRAVAGATAIAGSGSASALAAGAAESFSPLMVGLLSVVGLSLLALPVVAAGTSRVDEAAPSGGTTWAPLLAPLLIVVGFAPVGGALKLVNFGGFGLLETDRLVRWWWLVSAGTVAAALALLAFAAASAFRAPRGRAPLVAKLLPPLSLAVIALFAAGGSVFTLSSMGRLSAKALKEQPVVAGIEEPSSEAPSSEPSAEPEPTETAPAEPEPTAVPELPAPRPTMRPRPIATREPETRRSVRVGGSIPEPRKLKNVSPFYPAAARQARVQGVVILECTIGVDGRVKDIKVLRGVPLLDAAAMDAVRQWVYTPTLLNGVPVPVIMTVTVNFKLS